MEAGTTRGDLVRNLMRGPTAIETRSDRQEKGTETTMRPRPVAPRGERENAAMGENELEQATLSMIALWAKFPGRRACEAGEFIQKILATMLVSARP